MRLNKESKAKIALVIGTVSLLLLLCNTPSVNSSEVQEADIIGVWRAEYTTKYTGFSGTETIAFRDDGSYQQTFLNESGYFYNSSWNSWYLDSDNIVHLEGGIWFPAGISEAERSSRGTTLSIPIHGKRVEVYLEKETFLLTYKTGREVILSHLPVSTDAHNAILFYKVESYNPKALPP